MVNLLNASTCQIKTILKLRSSHLVLLMEMSHCSPAKHKLTRMCIKFVQMSTVHRILILKVLMHYAIKINFFFHFLVRLLEILLVCLNILSIKNISCRIVYIDCRQLNRNKVIIIRLKWLAIMMLK
jgi:hypothetical protein